MPPFMSLALAAISVSEQIEKYGAYVGIAAFFGLAEERAASASWNATADETSIPAPERTSTPDPTA